MKNKMNGVATTSLLVAAMRAVESKRSDSEGRLFSDPFAETLAGVYGYELMQRAIDEVGNQPAIAVRTAFIDEKFQKALASGARQVVIMAAGMDSRAYRFNFPNGTKVFELDQPEVLAYKAEKLLDAKTNCLRKEVEVDLREEWQNKLLEAGFNRGEKTLWTVEGLLMYLNENEVVTLFERINTLASTNDIMLFDIFTRNLLEAPHMQKQLEFLASLGAPWKFGTNEPELFLKKLGWSAVMTQPGDYAPERWPFPVAPIHIPNVPRSFFVEALKLQSF
jgi:methyltransferase (TIGR00027 family)